MQEKIVFRVGAAVLVVACILAAAGCGKDVEPADLVLRGGKVVTVDESRPVAEAVAVRGDRITAVGSDGDIEHYIGEATVLVELDGRTAVPGFIDSHAHFLGLGRSKTILDLTNARTWDEIVVRVWMAADRAEPGTWIVGRGWHQEKWDRPPRPSHQGLPLHDGLSQVSPENPVLLTHASGHAVMVNARALELAGIDRDTPDPPGGEIVRGSGGEPTGMLRENAERLVTVLAFPGFEEETARRYARLAAKECLSNGVTSFQDAGSTLREIGLFEKLADEGELELRLWVMIGVDTTMAEEDSERFPLIGYGDNRLTVRAVKRYIDGALGSHGAWLFEPYADLPSTSGINTTDVDSLEHVARIAAAGGLQLCIHAIGDRAVHEVLDIYERVLGGYPDGRDRRWRIEHAQHVAPADIPRFSRLGVIAAMQGIHCTSDGPWVIERIGRERAEEGAYAWRSLIDAGTIVSNGTDAPVEDVDPIACFTASVTRRLPDGSVFFPGQRMTREEALRSYTMNAAYAAFEEDIKGSITPGKLADITVLSQDIMTVPDEMLAATEVVTTIVGGRIVYETENAR